MMTSVDGRIVVDHWPEFGDIRREYESTAATFGADGWLCGRVTMEPMAGALRGEDEVARQQPHDAQHGDYVAPSAHAPFAVAVDAKGRLRWLKADVDGDHLIALLGPLVSEEYLASLRDRGVSYVLVGERGRGEVDLASALEKLGTLFGIKTLLLEGGGNINGALLREGLVDEVSLLIAPVADGTRGTASLFDLDGTDAYRGRRLRLQAVEARAEGVVWLRYAVEG
jgi:riboflavin biosynthesis pyrimidine reductase